jgi:hypothetical protein
VAIPGEWRRRYEHFAPGALEEALVQLERRIAAERGRLFDARFERGEYEVIYPGDPPPIPALPGSDGRLPLEEVRSITDPASAASRAHVARLPLLEHSDFYALLDERDWLAERLGR